jgi:hypothetical protein
MYTLKVAGACLLHIQEVILRLPTLIPLVVFVGPNRKMMEQYAKTGHNGFLPHFPQFIIHSRPHISCCVYCRKHR